MDNYEPQTSGTHVKFGHEETDFNLRGIILFLVILVLSAILTLFIAWGLLVFFEKIEVTYIDKKPTAVQRQLSNQRGGELRKTKGELKPSPDWYNRAVDEKAIERTFAAPRLQYDDTDDMNRFVEIETTRLNSTGKDEDGSIHIPIDRAMDLVSQQGLPPVNGTFVAGPAKGDLAAVAQAAQQRLNESKAQGQPPPVRKK